MALIKSVYESVGYYTHYGAGTSYAHMKWDYTWPLNVLHGKIGVISDNIVVGAEDFEVDSIIFGEKFQEESVIIDAKFRIETASAVQTDLRWAIYDSNKDGASQVHVMFETMPSDSTGVFRDMSNNSIALPVPAESYLGLVNKDGGVPITNCHFSYTILFSTN